MHQPIRVLIIDDYQLFTEAVASLLSAQEKIVLVRSTTNLDEALDRLQSQSVDVVLVDANMGKADPLEIIRELKEEFPDVKVIVLGLERREDNVLPFIEAGANGYVLKDASFDELLHIIEAVHRGRTPCSPRIAALVFARITELSQERNQRELLQPAILTPREREILQLIAAGLSNKDLAQQLHISLPTVRNHVHNILGKLQVHRRQEAIRCAYENGMLKGPWPCP